VMAGFAGALERRVAVAFFVPALVYLADAIGTQTETIAVRFLSLQQGHGGALLRLLVGEVFTGLLIGAALGAAAFPAVLLGFGDARLALAVSLATVAGSAMASAIIHFGRRLHLSADRRAVAVPQVLPH